MSTSCLVSTFCLSALITASAVAAETAAPKNPYLDDYAGLQQDVGLICKDRNLLRARESVAEVTLGRLETKITDVKKQIELTAREIQRPDARPAAEIAKRIQTIRTRFQVEQTRYEAAIADTSGRWTQPMIEAQRQKLKEARLEMESLARQTAQDEARGPASERAVKTKAILSASEERLKLLSEASDRYEALYEKARGCTCVARECKYANDTFDTKDSVYKGR